MSIRVTKCLCFEVEFETLVHLANKTGAKTIPDLQEHITFGKRCRLCHPYVRRALITGETVFTELLLDEDENEGQLNE